MDTLKAADPCQVFLDLSRDGYLAFDRECRYTYWSEGMERISGVPVTRALGRRAFELFPFLAQIGQAELIARVLKGETVTFEAAPFSIPETHRSGFFNARYFPRWQDGEVIGGLGIITDVTERVRADELRRESEQRFTNMANASPVMLWMAGKDSQCNFFNQSWLTFTGRSLSEEWGDGWAAGIHGEDTAHCLDFYRASFSERKTFEMEFRLRRADGQYRWMLDRGTPRYSPGGEFEGFIGSCVDISERKKMEADLVEAIRVREDFISIASHELRTPLTALSLQVGLFEHLMAKSIPTLATERARVLMDISRRQILHLSELIEKLLDLSRISAGKFIIEKKSMDLVKTALEVQERLGDAARQSASTIVLKGDACVMGKWDKSRLDQVISNLVNNSLKYAAGTPITITVSKSDRCALLEVEDLGPGIPSAYMPVIFDKFRRGTHDANRGGLGLGLFIVKEIISAHDGSIEVKNKPDQGAMFKVHLPL